MISKDPHGSGPAAITIRSWNCLGERMSRPLLICAIVALGFWVYVSVIACYIIAALEGIALLYRARSHGVRFDDTGITVSNFYQTHKLRWHQVGRFTDGKVHFMGGENTPDWDDWAVAIVLKNGRSVTAEGTARGKESNVAKVLATMEQVAARWQIPSQLTGKIDQAGKPASVADNGDGTARSRARRRIPPGHPAVSSQPRLDLDQVARGLAGLLPGWAERGITAGQLTWRDAQAAWPQPIVTNRVTVTEPESVGVTLTAANGNEALLVIWRGGWADVDLLLGGHVVSRAPDLHDAAACVALAQSIAERLVITP